MYILRNYLLYMNAREGATNVLSGNHIYHPVQPAITHIHTSIYMCTRAHNTHVTHDNIIVIWSDSLSLAEYVAFYVGKGGRCCAIFVDVLILGESSGNTRREYIIVFFSPVSYKFLSISVRFCWCRNKYPEDLCLSEER